MDDNNRVIIVNSDGDYEWQRKAPKTKRTGKVLKTIISLMLVAAVSVGSAAAYLHFAGGKTTGAATAGSASTVIQQVTKTSTIGTAESRDGTKKTIPEIYAECVKSTVLLTCKRPATNSGLFFGFYGQQPTQRYSTVFGSGVIMSSDGYIITNHHIVEEAEEVTVTMYDDTEYKGTVVGSDANTDIAVVKIDATGLDAATFGDSSALLVGEEAYAIGNPLNTQLAFTLTCGHVSALERELFIEDRMLSLIQIDTAINPGNSGGPVIDSNGNVIGIVDAKVVTTDVEGIAFAIPVNDALSIARSIIDYGYVVGRPMLGITVQSATPQQAQLYGVDAGITVVEVSQGSCAEKGGMKVGDKITHFNGVAISTTSELNFQKEKYKVGDTVTVTVEREGKSVVLNITLGN
ncbi:MAG: trypsin-like peptidase domain-containing protein [Clostridia bacterium]|nr:trypsin-like peptidase domain-containing protein [Clostridia bacterium]